MGIKHTLENLIPLSVIFILMQDSIRPLSILLNIEIYQALALDICTLTLLQTSFELSLK